jgi:uncharacterized membrane protein
LIMSDLKEQGIPAVAFLVMAFTDENMGDQALAELKEAKSKKQFDFEDAAVIRQDAQGKVKYYETGDMHAGKGAGIGALVGGVLGILGGPGGAVVGAGVGAAIGGAAASGDRDTGTKTLIPWRALKPGTSALAVITSHDALKAVQKEVAIEDIKTAVSNLSEELSARLAENKSVAIGLFLSEEGLAVGEIAADEESAQVLGAVITGEGIFAGEAVITDEGVAYSVLERPQQERRQRRGVITDEGQLLLMRSLPLNRPRTNQNPR